MGLGFFLGLESLGSSWYAFEAPYLSSTGFCAISGSETFLEAFLDC